MTEKRARAASKITFESELEKLEEIVRLLESGETPLAELLARYEEGVGRLKSCRAFLADAELRLEQLRADAGAPESFTPPASSGA